MRLLHGLLRQQPEYCVKGKACILRSPCMEDFGAWRELRQASRSFLEPWEPSWQDDEFLLSAFRRRIAHYAKLAIDDLAYPFFIFASDGETLQGGITLSNVRRGVAQMGTLGYWIGQAFANQGVMTDALATIIAFARDEVELHRLEAACLPRNTASVRLLERAQFEREGFARNYLKINGNWEDHALWGKALA